MDTPRFNVFNQIHKGLRALMCDTIMQLQQTDLADEEKSRPALAQTALMLDFFDTHAWHEDNFVLAAAKEHAPEVMAMFEQEHVEDHLLSDQLREKIEVYGRSENKYEAGRQLYYAVTDFVAFNLRHMNKEEVLLNSILWKHYSDAEILGMERNIQQSVTPEKMLLAIKWMVKGINDTELTHWIDGVKRGAPAVVLQMLLTACETHLPAQRSQRVTRFPIEALD